MVKNRKKRSSPERSAHINESTVLHPITGFLIEFLIRSGLEKSNIATLLNVKPSHVTRLLRLDDNTRIQLGLLKRIAEVVQQKAAYGGNAGPSTENSRPPISWGSFVDSTPTAVLYRLGRAVLGIGPMDNPIETPFSPKDEFEWQQRVVPAVRWIITDTLAENSSDDFLEQTCRLLKDPKFKILSLILPNTAGGKKQFDSFRRAATVTRQLIEEQSFREKVRCILTNSWAFSIRMRLDDPMMSPSPLRGGVAAFGLASSPGGGPLPPDTMQEIEGLFAEPVRDFDFVIKSWDGPEPITNFGSVDDFQFYYPRHTK